MLEKDEAVDISLTDALTPSGLGGSCVVPLIRHGFVDSIVGIGANLYHDTHFAIVHKLHQGSPNFDDPELRKQGVIRIYDIVLDCKVLLETDFFQNSGVGT